MRRACLVLAAIFALPCSCAMASTAAAAQNPALAAVHSPAQIQVRLGNSIVTLAGPWKFAPGDSPWVNENFLWASPAFNDTAWTNMDLHSAGEIDATYGSGGYIDGWAARGFPHLAGFAWYRLLIHADGATGPLWLKMPDHVDDAYQIYANGRFVGQFGQFTSKGVTCYRSRPLIFPLPAPDAHGDIVLAIRFYLEPMTLAEGTSTASGGMHQAPVLGLRAPIESILAQAVGEEILEHIVAIFVSFLLLLAAIGAFRLWLLDRPRWMYLWLALAFVLIAAGPVILTASIYSYAIPQDPLAVVMEMVSVLGIVCWILFWRDWFGLERNLWMEFLVFASAAGSILLHSLYVCTQSLLQAMAFMLDLRDVFEIVLTAMIFVVLLQGARKDRIGALFGLIPTVLLVIALFSFDLLSWFSIRTSWFPFGVQVGTDAIAMFLLIVVVGILVARRFLSSQVSQRLERQAVEQELEQARELQQHVLIPEPVTSAIFTVETAYHPARTVGGDFFQIVPYGDGSLLIVIGDVSGKGIAAAMLVAVLVGAVRTRAEETTDPAAILHTMNERLLGRAGGHFATCVVAHLRPDGVMTVANAGHLPPYRNGAAIDLPGSLPLGIVSDPEHEIHTIQLEPADYLTFLTDGVLEARNSSGQLLGFDRVAQISSLASEAIAQTAIAYGQEDDITVVSVHFGAKSSAIESCPTFEAWPI